MTKTAEELAADFKKSLDTQIDAIKEIAADAKGRAEKGEQLSQSAKEKADEGLSTMNEMKSTLADMQQRLARQSDHFDRADGAKSIGQHFVEDEGVKAFLASDAKRGKVDMSMKATLTSAVTADAGSVGGGAAPFRMSGINAQGERRMVVRDLLMQGTMESSAVEFVRETGFTNNADVVAEMGLKPNSDITLELVQANAKVIAHTFKASRQVLDDIPQLQSLLDAKGRYGLAFKEELQILRGDGTGQQLLGLLPQAAAYDAASELADATAIDRLRFAMLQAVLAEYPASGHVLHPIDWAKIETTKDNEGRYVIGNPVGDGPAMLWKLPVVETQAQPVGTFLTGAFGLGAQIFDRWAARVEIATQNGDDFERNMITMLVEERLALATYRPEAFITGDLTYPPVV